MRNIKNLLALILGLAVSLSLFLPEVEARQVPTQQLGVIYGIDHEGDRVLIGSAFAVKADDGYKVVTAQHVGMHIDKGLEVCSVSSACISLDPKLGIGPIVGNDSVHDWMYWHLDELPAGLKASRLGAPAEIGDPVCALGAPMGRVGEYSCGRITNLSDVQHFDARIIHGNSGGPLLDTQNRVVGIVVEIDVMNVGPFPVLINTSAKAIPIESVSF